MKPPNHPWHERTQSLTAEEMRQLAGVLAYHLGSHDLAPPDLMLLQWHYYRAALMFTLTHNSAVQRVYVQERPSYFVTHPLHGLSQPELYTAEQLDSLRRLCGAAQASAEPVSQDALRDLGLMPRDFQHLFGLHDGQVRWEDLLDVQLRHLDPRGMWHAVTLIHNPAGPPLRLHLTYRDAESHGYTLGLSPDPEWTEQGAPVIASPAGDLMQRAGLRAQDFPLRLAPRKAGAA